MCEEESDDPEAVHKLLEINDSIHRTIERYKLTKKGDLEAASRIPKGTLGTTTGVSTNANNELSLIDFDPEPPSSNGNAPAAPTGATSLENDLLGLSLDEPAPGGISLGPGMYLCGVCQDPAHLTPLLRWHVLTLSCSESRGPIDGLVRARAISRGV